MSSATGGQGGPGGPPELGAAAEVAGEGSARERGLAALAELIAEGGVARFLLPPVVPGVAAFPEPWRPTLAGVATVLRRLADHAGVARRIVVEDARRGAPPTERKPATRLELAWVDGRSARFTLAFLGSDDVAGTLAHELGVAHALLAARAEDPYRAAEPPARRPEQDADLERGSFATIYLGLGVLAANAAFQQYATSGRSNGAYMPLEYDVLRAGHTPMAELAYLLAVQAVVRRESAPPAGLLGPQRDEVAASIDALRGQRPALCERLGIDPALGIPDARPALGVIEAATEADRPEARRGLRWNTHRGGVGFILGLALGGALGVAVARVAPALVLCGGVTGHLAGRRVRVTRCSRCATVIATGATTCRRCGATLRGDILHLNDRLDVEERLDRGERLAAGGGDAAEDAADDAADGADEVEPAAGPGA